MSDLGRYESELDRLEPWSRVIALILRDMSIEARTEFVNRMQIWTRTSERRLAEHTVDDDPYPGDRVAAASRLEKLQILQKNLERELESAEDMRSMLRRFMR